VRIELPPWPATAPAYGSVVLREYADADVPLACEMGEDPYIPLIGTLSARPTPEQALAWIREQRLRWAQGLGFSFAIADKVTGQAVGSIGLWLQNLGIGKASVGYAVSPQRRHKGYARDAMRALIRFAWSIPVLYRVEALIEPWNRGSIRVAESAGFRREALLPEHQEIGGAKRDLLRYSATRSSHRAGVPAQSCRPGRDASSRQSRVALPPWPVPAPSSGEVLLRQFMESDAQVAYELSTDPYVRLMEVDLPADPTVEQALGWIRGHRRKYDRGFGFSFAIADRTTDQAIGSISLWLATLPVGKGIVGYSISPDHRSKGNASQALQALVRFAWSIPVLYRIEALIEPWNSSSIHVAESAGFTREKLLPKHLEIDGTKRDMLLYAVRR
jgi:RimJ/RimL family protein N-acetyltransferase